MTDNLVNIGVRKRKNRSRKQREQPVPLRQRRTRGVRVHATQGSINAGSLPLGQSFHLLIRHPLGLIRLPLGLRSRLLLLKALLGILLERRALLGLLLAHVHALLRKALVPQKLAVHPSGGHLLVALRFLDAIPVGLAILIVVGVVLGLRHRC